MNATILPNEFAVRHSVRPDVGREFISWDIENGWDDVKKVCKKVVMYDGRKFVFSCWNSDDNYVCFARPIDGEVKTAKFVK